MKLHQLISQLEEYRRQRGSECEVRLMLQRDWPVVRQISGLTSREASHATQDIVVYILDGDQLGYG